MISLYWHCISVPYTTASKVIKTIKKLLTNKKTRDIIYNVIIGVDEESIAFFHSQRAVDC